MRSIHFGIVSFTISPKYRSSQSCQTKVQEPRAITTCSSLDLYSFIVKRPIFASEILADSLRVKKAICQGRAYFPRIIRLGLTARTRCGLTMHTCNTRIYKWLQATRLRQRRTTSYSASHATPRARASPLVSRCDAIACRDLYARGRSYFELVQVGQPSRPAPILGEYHGRYPRTPSGPKNKKENRENCRYASSAT